MSRENGILPTPQRGKKAFFASNALTGGARVQEIGSGPRIKENGSYFNFGD